MLSRSARSRTNCRRSVGTFQLEQQKLKLEQSIPTTMVMQEMPEARATFVLSRGEYDKPTERVSAGVPACLTWPGQPAIRNRLDFARWLVAPENR